MTAVLLIWWIGSVLESTISLTHGKPQLIHFCLLSNQASKPQSYASSKQKVRPSDLLSGIGTRATSVDKKRQHNQQIQLEAEVEMRSATIIGGKRGKKKQLNRHNLSAHPRFSHCVNANRWGDDISWYDKSDVDYQFVIGSLGGEIDDYEQWRGIE